MTLDEFIALKPQHIRLGQWFVISYCQSVHCQWEASINMLWAAGGEKAKKMIVQQMQFWQWETLPELKEK